MGFTEQRMFDDMNELRKSGKIEASKGGKRTFRTALELKYNLNKKALKKYEAFVIAFDRITEAVRGEIQNKEENAENEEEKVSENEEIEKSKKKKDKKKRKKDKKKKKKDKKSRKRKRENAENEEEESMDNPPKKKRKVNSRKSIVDNDENNENEENEADGDNLSAAETKKVSKSKRGKKKKSEPGTYTLTKLRKILKLVGAANPKLYTDLKKKSIKKQIVTIKEILTEKNVDFSNLSEKHIKKLRAEWELKKEMADLGIDTSKNDDDDNDEHQYKDGVTLSSRRPRRNANKAPISYRPQKPKYEEDDSEDEDANDDNAKEENQETSDEDVYEPPSEDDEDS